jgi:hypothetical protein
VSDLTNEPLIRALRDADRAAAELAVMVDALELSGLGRSAFTSRIRTTRQGIEWALCDLSVPQIEAMREKAAA